MMPTQRELDALWKAQPTEREFFEMYGRPVAIPRFLRMYSRGPLTVHVSGKDFDAAQLDDNTPTYLARLLNCVPASCEYNTVLCNWYPNGNDYIGWHGDKERQICSDSAPIVSLSLGHPRRFQVRHEQSNQIVVDMMLGDGDCVVMGGPGFQHLYKHRVPKMIAKKDGDVKRRLNLTVRKYASAISKRTCSKRDGESSARHAKAHRGTHER